MMETIKIGEREIPLTPEYEEKRPKRSLFCLVNSGALPEDIIFEKGERYERVYCSRYMGSVFNH